MCRRQMRHRRSGRVLERDRERIAEPDVADERRRLSARAEPAALRSATSAETTRSLTATPSDTRGSADRIAHARSTAPNLSASAWTIRARSLGGLVVGERALRRAERDPKGERALAGARLLAAVLVEDRRRAQLGTRRLAERREQVRRGDGVVDDEREILAHLRVRAHLLELDRRRRRRDERIEIELERAPDALEERRVQLADPALVRARRLPRMEVRLGRRARTPARPSARRRAARPPTSPRTKPPSTMPATCQRSSGSSPPVRYVRAISNSATSDVPTARLWRAASTRLPISCRAQRRRLLGERLGQPHVAFGDERRRVRLREAAAREHVLDESPQALPAGQPAEHRVALGQRERDLLHLEARDLLDEVDLARHVARAPGRHAEAAVRLLEAELHEDRRLLVGGDVEAEHGIRPLRAQLDHRRLGQRRLHVGVPGPARALRGRRSAGSPALRRDRRGAGRRPSPSGSSPRCGARGARSCGAARSARSSPPRAGPTSSCRRLRCRRRP